MKFITEQLFKAELPGYFYFDKHQFNQLRIVKIVNYNFKTNIVKKLLGGTKKVSPPF